MFIVGAVWLWTRATTRRALITLTLIGILAGLSGATVLVAVVGAQRTRSALDRAIAADDPAPVEIQAEDESAFAGLEQIPDIRLAVPWATYFGDVAGADKNIILFMSPRPFGVSVDRITPTSGRLPHAADEVMLTEQTAAALRVGVGDTLPFEAASWEEIDSDGSSAPPRPLVVLKIVGLGSTLIQKVQTDDAAGRVSEEFAAKYDATLAHVGGAGGMKAIDFVWVDGGEPAIESVRAALEQAPEPVAFNRFATFAGPARASMGTMASGVLVFAVAAALAGAGAVAVVIARYLARFRNDQVAMGALGASHSRRAVLGAASVVPAALVSGIVAAGAAVAGSRLMPFGSTARRVDPHVGATPGGAILVLAAVVVVAWVVFVGFAAAWPRRAGSPQAPGLVARLVSGPLSRWPMVTTGVRFAVSGRSGDQRGALRAALVAGALGVTAAVGGATFVHSLSELQHSPPRWGYTWTITIPDGDTAADDARELMSHAELSKVVSSWAVHTDAPATVNGVDVRVDTLDVLAGRLTPQILRGRAPASAGEVLLNAAFAADMDLSIGDSVTATTESGDVPLRVVGVATLYPEDSILLRYPALMMTPDGQAAITHGDTAYRIALVAAPGVSPEQLYDRLAAVMGDGVPSRADALAAPPSEVRNADQLHGAAVALALFVGVLGLVVVANAVFTTPRRRRLDLATLRALGMNRRDIAGTIAVETATLVLVAVVVGIPLGLITGRQAFAGVATHVGVDAGPFSAWGVIAVAVGVAVLIVPVLAAWPAQRAARSATGTALRRE